MNQSPSIQALKDISKSVDMTDRVGSLEKYSAARVIAYDMQNHYKAKGLNGVSAATSSAMRSLTAFVQHFSYAVMSSPDSPKSPAEWMELARADLTSVEDIIGGKS